MEIFSQQWAQIFTVPRSAAKEVFAGGQKVLVLFIIRVVQDFLFEKLPQTLNQVQIRRIARQIMQDNLRPFQFFLQPFWNITTRVVQDHMNLLRLRMFRFELFWRVATRMHYWSTWEREFWTSARDRTRDDRHWSDVPCRGPCSVGNVIRFNFPVVTETMILCHWRPIISRTVVFG